MFNFSVTKSISNSSQMLISNTSLSKPSVYAIAFKNFVWLHYLPYMCLIGIITNSINIVIFKNRTKLWNPIYKYMLVHSVGDLCFLSGAFVYFFSKHTFIYQYYSYFWKFFEFYLYMVIMTPLTMFIVLIELSISIKRLLIVTNYNITVRIRFRWLIIGFLLFSILSQLPSLKMIINIVDLAEKYQERNMPPHAAYFDMITADFSRSSVYKTIYTLETILRGVLAPAILFIINALMTKKFHQQLKKKRMMKSFSALKESQYDFCTLSLHF